MEAIFLRHEEATQSVLMTAGFAVPVTEIEKWSSKDVKAAENYATLAYYKSFNDRLSLPEMPAVLVPYQEVRHV